MQNWLIEQTVDLQQHRTDESPVWPMALMLAGDSMAHTWRVKLVDGGRPVAITGKVFAYFEREDGNTVLVPGTVEGNIGIATLPAQCYAVEGPLRAVMQITNGNEQIMSIILTIFHVAHSYSSAIIDPSDIIPSLPELLALIDAMRAEIALSQIATAGANTAAGTANTAAGTANAAAGTANTAATNANTAAASANAATKKWSNLEVDIDMLPPDEAPAGEFTQTVDTTTLHLDLPQGRVVNATLHLDDTTGILYILVPNVPQPSLSWAGDPKTTMLYMVMHGYVLPTE